LSPSPDQYKLRHQQILLHQHQSKLLQADNPHSSRTSSSKRADLAELIIRPRADLLRLLARVVALILVAGLVLILTAIGDCASVAVVCVDAAEHAAVAGEDVVDDDVASAAVAAAVTAGSDDFAVVCCVEVLDVERSWIRGQSFHKNERLVSTRS
jgi:hypothetical protein